MKAGSAIHAGSPIPASGERRRDMWKKIKNTASRFYGVLILIGLWFLVTEAGMVNASLLPSPSDVWAAASRMMVDGTLFEHTLASLLRVFWGFLIAFVLAIPLGLIVGISPGVKKAIEPVIELLRPIPPIAIIPLAILWFGIGESSKLFIIAYAAFFPLVLNVMGGIQNVEAIHIKAAQTLGANKLQLFYLVILRSAVPYIVIGMRSGVSMAFISLVAAELIASSTGLGFIIQEGRYMFRIDEVLVGIIAIGIVGYLINWLLIKLEQALVKWR